MSVYIVKYISKKEKSIFYHDYLKRITHMAHMAFKEADDKMSYVSYRVFSKTIN